MRGMVFLLPSAPTGNPKRDACRPFHMQVVARATECDAPASPLNFGCYLRCQLGRQIGPVPLGCIADQPVCISEAAEMAHNGLRAGKADGSVDDSGTETTLF
jgi:hypothetical protein